MKTRLPALLVLLLAKASTVFGAEASYTASVLSSTRARSSQPGDLHVGASGDLELLPLAAVRVQTTSLTLDLAYRPSILVRDLGGSVQPLGFHRGDTIVQWHRLGTALLAMADGATGQTYLGPLFSTDGTVLPGQIASSSTAGLVSYMRLAGSGAIAQAFTDRVSLRLAGGYEVSGSDDNARLPMQWGPLASAQLRVQVTPIDRLTSHLRFRHLVFATGHRQTIGEVSEGWARRLTRLLLLEVSGGAAIISQRAPAVVSGPLTLNSTLVQPVLRGELTYNAPTRIAKLELRTRAGLMPFSDRFTATAYPRFELMGGATALLVRRLTLGGQLSIARSFQPVFSDVMYAGEASAAYTLQPWIIVGAGVRAALVQLLAPNVTPQAQWLASLSLTLRDQRSTSW